MTVSDAVDFDVIVIDARWHIEKTDCLLSDNWWQVQVKVKQL